MSKERTNARILEKYKKQDPATLSRQEYDEICNSLDAAAAQHNQQGGQGLSLIHISTCLYFPRRAPNASLLR